MGSRLKKLWVGGVNLSTKGFMGEGTCPGGKGERFCEEELHFFPKVSLGSLNKSHCVMRLRCRHTRSGDCLSVVLLHVMGACALALLSSKKVLLVFLPP